jgi:hypothetical protein
MKPRLSYANVTSTLALLIALTGATAYAATKLPDRSVTNSKIAPEAVTGEKVNESTLTQVPSAAKADLAAAANPEAFGLITPEGIVDQNLSKRIAAVKEGSLAGIYCVSAAGLTPGALRSPCASTAKATSPLT